MLLFNVLHFKEREDLLKESMRVLSDAGRIYVILWRSDIKTPRGLSQDIRPKPENIIRDADEIGMKQDGETVILEPYHWGIKLKK